jgi:hypothetical protein
MLDLVRGRMLAVVVMMMMAMARSENGSRKHDHQQCSAENLLHGMNPSMGLKAKRHLLTPPVSEMQRKRDGEA